MVQFSFSSPPRQIGAFLLVLCWPAASGAASYVLPGVPNFQKVNEHVYRGGQPTDTGFGSLAKLGVRTIVDLRLIGEHSQAAEQRLVEAMGMRYVSIPMRGMTTPANEQVSKVLALLSDAAAAPVFVHCQRGADRTGAVIACYRIGHDQWESKKALSEARSYGMSWYQRALQNYVIQYRPRLSTEVSPGASALAQPSLPPRVAGAP